MNDRILTTAEVAKYTGFTVRQLDYWSKIGLVVPVNESSGPGTRRGYGFNNLLTLLFIRSLMAHGWSTHKSRRAVDILRIVLVNPEPSVMFFNDEKHERVLAFTKMDPDSEDFRTLLGNDQPTAIISIAKLTAEAHELLNRATQSESATAE